MGLGFFKQGKRFLFEGNTWQTWNSVSLIPVPAVEFSTWKRSEYDDNFDPVRQIGREFSVQVSFGFLFWGFYGSVSYYSGEIYESSESEEDPEGAAS